MLVLQRNISHYRLEPIVHYDIRKWNGVITMTYRVSDSRMSKHFSFTFLINPIRNSTKRELINYNSEKRKNARNKLLKCVIWSQHFCRAVWFSKRNPYVVIESKSKSRRQCIVHLSFHVVCLHFPIKVKGIRTDCCDGVKKTTHTQPNASPILAQTEISTELYKQSQIEYLNTDFLNVSLQSMDFSIDYDCEEKGSRMWSLLRVCELNK